jgi:hypothetical protein
MANAVRPWVTQLLSRVPRQTADRLVGALVVGGALLSGWLVLKATGETTLAAGFAAVVVAAGALLLLARYLYPPVATAERSTDWALVPKTTRARWP